MTSPIPPEAAGFVPKTAPVDFSVPFDTSKLKGRSVFITGGASGIGLASAAAFATAGALVTIGDVRPEAGAAAVESLAARGLTVNFVPCDVTNYESQFAAFKNAIAHGGGTIDIVVANAGILAERDIVSATAAHEVSLDTMPPPPGHTGLDVNLTGVYYTAYLAMYFFRLPPVSTDATPFQKGLVLVGSTASYAGYPQSATYSMSKFGVRGLFWGTRDSAMGQKLPVRVNLVAPWFIKTGMTTGSAVSQELADRIEAFGWVPIEYVSDAIVRLGGDEAVSGRAVTNMPGGNFDLGDDPWGGLGGVVMQEQLGARYKDIMTAFAKAQAAKAAAQTKV